MTSIAPEPENERNLRTMVEVYDGKRPGTITRSSRSASAPAPTTAPVPVAILLVASAGETGVPLRIEGTTAQLILALASHAGDIDHFTKGSVELHYGPGGVTGRFHPLWDSTYDPDVLLRLGLPHQPQRQPLKAVIADDEGAETLIIRGTERMP